MKVDDEELVYISRFYVNNHHIQLEVFCIFLLSFINPILLPVFSFAFFAEALVLS